MDLCFDYREVTGSVTKAEEILLTERRIYKKGTYARARRDVRTRYFG